MKTHVLMAAALAALASQVVMAASEGGDTWSEIQPVQHSAYSPLRSVQRTDLVDSDPDASFEGSEGGDTWSRFAPQFRGQAVGSADLASTRDGTRAHWQPPFGQ